MAQRLIEEDVAALAKQFVEVHQQEILELFGANEGRRVWIADISWPVWMHDAPNPELNPAEFPGHWFVAVSMAWAEPIISTRNAVFLTIDDATEEITARI